jgi:WD40 repeat protein
MIKTIHKKKGESVRNLEPVVQILNLKKLRAEGLMDRQHLYRLGDSKKQREAKVFLEVAPTEAPRRILKGHRQEVTSVAVGRGRDGKCFIVSTSEDHTLRVWSPEAEKEQLVVKLPHGATPKCVACSPLGGRTSLVMCGASDGIVRVWDVNERPAGATGSPEPKFKLEPHSGAVTSVAISPDGVYGASGGEDRQICIWDLNNGKLLYSIPDAHTGIITTLQFTPKAQLLSAGRDNYIRVWELGDKAARLEMNQPNRSGDVAQIGASPDGKSILFDHGREIQVLSVPGGLNEGYLHRPPKGGGFTGFALFSPDGELILTSGGSENVIQLWRAPTGGDRRGYEVRQMVLNPRSQATCAAFAPDGTFVITGHKNKDICVWKTPTADELGEVVPAQLVLADQTAESSAGQVRVWANVLKEGLIPNTMGTLVIEPGQ